MGDKHSPQSLHRWNYTQSNPVNYTDPSGYYCIAGYDVEFLGGEKCTDADRENAIEAFNYLRGYINSPSFVLGAAYEIVDSAMIIGPETARLAWSLILKSNPLLNDLAEVAVMNAALCGNNNPSAMLNLIKNGIQGDYYFNQGRAVGRSIALAYALNQITIGVGGTSVAAALGPFTFGFSLSATPVTVSITAYGAAVMANVAIKEINDHIIYNAIIGKGRLNIPSSSRLGSNMERAGRSRPPNSAAHHIVAGTDRRAAEARAILSDAGIGINDADNGAWLPDVFHRRVHTDAYFQAVNDRLAQANSGSIRAILRMLGQAIETGTFP